MKIDSDVRMDILAGRACRTSMRADRTLAGLLLIKPPAEDAPDLAQLQEDARKESREGEQHLMRLSFPEYSQSFIVFFGLSRFLVRKYEKPCIHEKHGIQSRADDVGNGINPQK